MSLDARIAAALDVVRGATAEEAARNRSVEPELVERWAAQFVAAGTAAITNTPNQDEAAGRDRFLSAIGHELRTPVTVLRGWLDLVNNPDLGAERRAQANQIMSQNISRLERTIGLMEDTAAASLGRLSVDVETLSLHTLFGDLPIRPDHHLDVDLTVQTDRRRLGQVLVDVISTLERLPGTEQVRLHVDEEPAWIRFRVVRQGTALDAGVVHALFEPFSAREGQTDITFGLYRARALVVALGGQIGVDADPEDETFWIRIPRVRSDPASAPNHATHLKIVKDET